MINIKTNSIGVDISTSSVKVADIQKTRKGAGLQYFAEEKIPVSALVAGVIRQPDNVKAALLKCLEQIPRKKNKKLYAVCTIPDDKVYMQEGDFPKLEYKKLKEAIQFKIQTFIPLPISEVYWDFEIIGDNANGSVKVLITAASKETVDSYYDVIKSAGIIPIRFESSSMSSIRFIESSGNMLLLDIGRTQATISLSEGDIIKFTSTVHTGLNQLIKAYDEFFGIDDDKSIQLLNESGLDLKNEKVKEKILEIFEPLKQELNRTLNYQNNDKIKEIYVYGEGSTTKGLLQFLSEDISAEFKELNTPVQNLKNLDPKKIVPVLGAAIHHTQRETKKRINFLPDKAAKEIFQSIIVDKIFLALRTLAINMVAYIVIFGMFSYFLIGDQLYLNQKLEAINSGTRKSEYTQIGNSINAANTSLQKIQAAQGAYIEWMPFLQEIPTLAPSGISIVSYSITKQSIGWTVQISGRAADRNSLLTYLNNLEFKSKYLTGVDLPIQYIQGDQTITFTIAAKLNKLN